MDRKIKLNEQENEEQWTEECALADGSETDISVTRFLYLANVKVA